MIYKTLSGSFTIVLQGKFRSSISELVCKHRVWPEAAEAGTSRSPSLSENLVGCADTRAAADWFIPGFCGKTQFQFRGSKSKCSEKHVALHTTALVIPPRFAPAGLCRRKVSRESQIHIAVCSGLRIKKWVQMIRQRRSWT